MLTNKMTVFDLVTFLLGIYPLTSAQRGMLKDVPRRLVIEKTGNNHNIQSLIDE